MNLMSTYTNAHNPNRQPNDYYPTPPVATRALIEHFGHIFTNPIWECAAGRGWISKELLDHGFEVVSSDLHQYDSPIIGGILTKDFLLDEPLNCGCIITNPPFKFMNKFITRALNITDTVIVYGKLTTLESIGRYQIFQDSPCDVLVFSSRTNHMEDYFADGSGQVGGKVGHAWFIWHPEASYTINWVKPDLLNSYFYNYQPNREKLYEYKR